MLKLELPDLKAPSSKNVTSSYSNLLDRDISLFGFKLSDKYKESFFKELTLLISAKIDIKSVFELIIAEQENKQVKDIYENIKSKIITGSSLSKALESSGYFSNYEIFSIKIGEETGRLAQVLTDLTDFYSAKNRNRKMLIQVLTYPLVILFSSFLVIIFMLKFIVPMFEDVFKRFNSDLPELTKFIIRLSKSSTGILLVVMVFTTIIIFAYTRYQDRQWFKKLHSTLLLKIPFIGPLIHKIYLLRFCNSMSLMMAAKIPMLTAIELVSKMIGFYPFEESLKIIHRDITNGKSLYTSLSNHKIYPSRVLSLVKVGEEVNQLESIFNNLSKQFSSEVDHKTSMLGSLIEPIMIVILGIIVATILVSIYLPIFQLGTSIH